MENDKMMSVDMYVEQLEKGLKSLSKQQLAQWS